MNISILSFRICTLMIAITALVGFSPVQSEAATIGSPQAVRGGLVGYWSFDGKDVTDKVYDRSGQGNDGYLFGGATTSAKIAGKVGQALKLDGVDDYISAQGGGVLDIRGAITISLWGRFNTLIPNNGDEAMLVLNVVPGNYLYSLSLFNAGGSKVLEFRAGGGTDSSNTSNPLSINANEWHHFVVTFDTTSAVVTKYVDGVSVGTTSETVSGGYAGGTGTLIMGTDYPAPLVSLVDGSIDEVRIYDRALSVSEVKALYRMGQAKLSKSAVTSVKNGLVGWWTFDGPDISGTTVLDKSGQGNNGTLDNGARVSGGKMGQGISFDGVDDTVTVPDNASLRTSDFSVAAWLKLRSLNPGGYYTFVARDNASDHNNYALSYDNVAGTWNSAYDPNWAVDYVNYTATPIFNKWYHFVTTYNDTTKDYRLFLNGVQVAQNTAVNTPETTSGGALLMGWDPTNGAFQHFDGVMDDVRVYNRPITPAEVKSLYNEGGGISAGRSQAGLIPNGLIGYWSLNGPDFTDAVYDRSGQGNHGSAGFNVATASLKTAGRIGQGAKFNGSSDFITMGDINSLDGLTALTASAWVKTTATGERHIFDKSDCNGNSDGGVFELAMRYSVEGKPAALIYPSGGSPTNYYFIEGGTDINDGRWHHVAETYDGTNLRLYVDGIQDAAPVSAPGVTTASTAGEVEIGGDCNGHGGLFWNGNIDEVRVYNRALSAAEIKRLYQTGM